MLKIFFYTFLVYLLCIACVFIANEIFIEVQSSKDIEGFAVFSSSYFLFLTVVIYLPALNIIEAKAGAKYRKYYPVITAFLLNLPFFIFAIIFSGKAFQQTERLFFSIMYIVPGAVFGKLFSIYKFHTKTT